MPSFTWSNAKTLHLIGIPLIWISYGFAVAPQHAIIEAAFNQFHWLLGLGTFASLTVPLFGCMLLQDYLFPLPVKRTLPEDIVQVQSGAPPRFRVFNLIAADICGVMARFFVFCSASSLGKQIFEDLNKASIETAVPYILVKLAFFAFLPLLPWAIGIALNSSEFKILASRCVAPLSDSDRA